MFSAVVLTPGRTGSQLILKNLSHHFKKNARIIHSHDPLIIPVTAESWVFVSHRRDIFSSIISTLVGTRTNEFTQYQGKYNKRFTVEQIEFTNAYQHHQIFYKVINKNNFAQCIDVYYEELIADPYYLFSKLDIKKPINLTLQDKSPYNNKELIINIDQCYNWFEQLNSQEITQSEIEFYQNSIQQHLDGIRQHLEMIKKHGTIL
jgi:hypothetical protein